MRTARTLSREQLRELERALRSERGRLERSMARARSRRIARRACAAPAAQDDTGSLRRIAPSPGTLARHEELVAAIRRLEAGTYGGCAVCEAPIEYERLVRSPKATHCAECAGRA